MTITIDLKELETFEKAWESWGWQRTLAFAKFYERGARERDYFARDSQVAADDLKKEISDWESKNPKPILIPRV